MKSFLSLIFVFFSISSNGQEELNYLELNWIELSDEVSYVVEEIKDSILLTKGDTLKVELIGVIDKGVFERRVFPDEINQICGQSAIFNLDEICDLAPLKGTFLLKTRLPSIEDIFSEGLYMTVSLIDSISYEETKSLMSLLTDQDYIKSCKYITIEDIKSEFEDLESNIRHFMGELEIENSIELTIKIEHLNDLETISEQIQADHRIDKVFFNQELLNSIIIRSSKEVILRIKT